MAIQTMVDDKHVRQLTDAEIDVASGGGVGVGAAIAVGGLAGFAVIGAVVVAAAGGYLVYKGIKKLAS